MKCTLFKKWIFPPWCNASSELFLAAKIQTVHSWKQKNKWNTLYAHQAEGRTWGKYPVNSTRSSVDIFRSSLFLCHTACCAAALAGRAVGWWAPSAPTSCKGVSRRSDQMTGHAQAWFFFPPLGSVLTTTHVSRTHTSRWSSGWSPCQYSLLESSSLDNTHSHRRLNYISAELGPNAWPC